MKGPSYRGGVTKITATRYRNVGRGRRRMLHLHLAREKNRRMVLKRGRHK